MQKKWQDSLITTAVLTEAELKVIEERRAHILKRGGVRIPVIMVGRSGGAIVSRAGKIQLLNYHADSSWFGGTCLWRKTEVSEVEWAATEVAPRLWGVVSTVKPSTGRPCGGFTMFELVDLRSDSNGWSRAVIANTALNTLLLWFVAQPLLYFLVFSLAAVDGELDAMHMWFGGAIAVRESFVLVCVLLGVHYNPAFLLVDLGASVSDTSLGSAHKRGCCECFPRLD